MTQLGSNGRLRWNVGVTKIRHADRDVARDVLGDTGEARDFADVLGADTPDDDTRFPLGSDCVYTVDLTDDEVERFRAASNCRYVTPEVADSDPCTPANVPTAASRAVLRQTFTNNSAWHGRNINVAVLDTGTTAALRAYMGYSLVARGVGNSGDPPPSGGVYDPDHVHGSLVASAAVPAGGRLLDYVIVGRDERATPGWIASGIRWACDNGAKVINISHGLLNTNNQMAPAADALNYMQNFDTICFAAAGNNSTNSFLYPAAFCFSIPYVHGVMSYDEATLKMATSSNYTTSSTAGMAPGNPIRGVTGNGSETDWFGTSAAAPFAASCAVRMLTKGEHTAKQVSTALKENFRNMGISPQGGGMYDMHTSLTRLGAFRNKAIPAGAWVASLW